MRSEVVKFFLLFSVVCSCNSPAPVTDKNVTKELTRENIKVKDTVVSTVAIFDTVINNHFLKVYFYLYQIHRQCLAFLFMSIMAIILIQ